MLTNVNDIRQQPAFTIPDAARYLHVSAGTLRSWVSGQSSLLETPKPNWLSFLNLVEAHVLASIRSEHIPLQRVRRSLSYLSKKFQLEHPLAEKVFQTDGVDLFVEHMGTLVNTSREGQLASMDLIRAFLKRLDRDTRGLPIRLYPYTFARVDATPPLDLLRRLEHAPRAIVIDPRISFGRPSIAGSGVAVDVLVSRFKAGERTSDLANDYGLQETQVEEALRSELAAA